MKLLKCYECDCRTMKEVRVGKNCTVSTTCGRCGVKQSSKISKSGEMSIRYFGLGTLKDS